MTTTQTLLQTTAPVSTPRVCERTGFVLREFPVLGVWKVFDNTYDAISAKPHGGLTRNEWARWDLEGEETTYGATARVGAFAEVLAPLRPRLDQLNALARAELDEDSMDDFTGIEDELAATGMASKWLPAGWRFSHGIAQVGAGRQGGWYVDVDSAITINAIRRQIPDHLTSLGYADLDVSHIRSGDRILTGEIAEYISWTSLEDGSSPAGVRFESRHGSALECWAIWDRVSPEVLHESREIAIDDEDFLEVLTAFGLRPR